MDVWVGGRAHTSDLYFTWESGVPVDEPETHRIWQNGQPNTGGSAFACLFLEGGSQIYSMLDTLCSSNKPSFLCELPL